MLEDADNLPAMPEAAPKPSQSVVPSEKQNPSSTQPSNPVTPPKNVGGRPRNDAILSPENVARIKRKEIEQKAREQKRLEKKQAAQAAATEKALHEKAVPVRGDELTRFKPGVSGNPNGRPKMEVREALERALVRARATPNGDKSRLDALSERIYHLAMDPSCSLELLLKAYELIGNRLDGKPTVESAEGGGNAGNSLVINIGSRFAPAQVPNKIDDPNAIDVEVL
jgi:hypothetical protein